jgi:hypothetical protein
VGTASRVLGMEVGDEGKDGNGKSFHYDEGADAETKPRLQLMDLAERLKGT